ncbi:MAG: tRNA-specific adenosine deaminase [Ignavibacteria bacterium GWB2_35_12]|nr:MAG: tRNA-specific adenosine deaminase [Ignavibacteria bacterium GWA2_35_8]OGU40786.1 MAG: tRNA-specific adenosine deaminase [Ignavibacteria bacterium GWB2_35_12]OGU94148.1 MAG: tRNA-specific adenosine deaminase [Ignavibacteria bacterium RIFOXYA2_FULL_35_10]OGV23744.1 MAG: tRNA-specific adenosine deaminase [Ignavibacteria bacterium RIFOXYC2_FULL_35_21]
MKEAIKEARKCSKHEDVPIGTVVVLNNKIIGRGYNQVEKLKDPTAHAELIAIRKAIKYINYKHLINAILYVTLEPCPMCAGSIVLTRIKKVVYGASEPKTGACGSIYNIIQDKRLNHRCEVVKGVLEDECSQLIKDFFNKLRGK